jgi:hypothetical protein
VETPPHVNEGRPEKGGKRVRVMGCLLVCKILVFIFGLFLVNFYFAPHTKLGV